MELEQRIVIAAQVLWQHLFAPNGMIEHTTQRGVIDRDLPARRSR
jgi:hypothetical protein